MTITDSDRDKIMDTCTDEEVEKAEIAWQVARNAPAIVEAISDRQYELSMMDLVEIQEIVTNLTHGSIDSRRDKEDLCDQIMNAEIPEMNHGTWILDWIVSQRQLAAVEEGVAAAPIEKLRMFYGLEPDNPKKGWFFFRAVDENDPIFKTLKEYYEAWPIEDGKRYFWGTRLSDGVTHVFVAESETDPKYLLYDPERIQEIFTQEVLDELEDDDFED